MPTKFTYKEVQKYVEERGYTLLTKVYSNSLQKLEIICPIHGEQKVTLKWLKKGVGCFKCGQEIKVAHRRLSIEFIKNEVEKLGYFLISNVYKNSKIPITLKCLKHGEFTISYDSIKAGHGCRDCGYVTVGEKTRTSFEEIKKIISKTPYVLLSTDYSKHSQKIEMECKIHGKFKLALDRIKMGQGCFKCGHHSGRLKVRKTHQQFIEEISHFGYEVLTQYVTSQSPITVKCPKHGEFTVIAYSLTNGHRCSGCANSESLAEKELLRRIKEVYPNAKKLRSKTNIEGKPFIKRFEADLYIKEKNKGIEFDGTHWHKFKTMRKDKSKRLWSDDDIRNYHKIKDAHFLSIGIEILHIKEEDWLIDKEACVKHCLDFLAKHPILSVCPLFSPLRPMPM